MISSSVAAECETCRDVGKVGIWFFLGTEVMLFAGFLAAYVALRWGSEVCALGAPAWPAENYRQGLALAALNTAVLLTSSYTMVRALIAAQGGDRRVFSRFLSATLLLGVLFLCIKSGEYVLKAHHGLTLGGPLVKASPGHAIFLSFYYGMTGLHALHMLAGLIWSGLILVAGKSAEFNAAFVRRVEYAGLYWHFVDVVWVFLFPLFYLI